MRSTFRRSCSSAGRSAIRSSATARGCSTNADLTEDEEDEITGYVKKLLNDSLQRADESPQPDPATLLDGVYATPEDLDTPHHK